LNLDAYECLPAERVPCSFTCAACSIDRMLKDMELAAAAAAANSEVVANDTAVISEGGMGSDLVPATTTHAGFCKLGVRCAIMDSKAMRNAFGMNCTGMLVTHVAPAGAAKDVLLKDDVLLSIDGHAIANDGTVVFRGHERIAFQYFTSLKVTRRTPRWKLHAAARRCTPFCAQLTLSFHRLSASPPASQSCATRRRWNSSSRSSPSIP
jgi:hypothetical protein